MRATRRLISVVLLTMPACMGDDPDDEMGISFETGEDNHHWSADASDGVPQDGDGTTDATPSPEPNGSTMADDESGGTAAPDPDPSTVGTSGDDGPVLPDGPGFCTHTCTADSDCIATESLGPMICTEAGSCSHDCSSDDDCTLMINGPLWEASVPCSAGGGECDVFGPYYACMQGPSGAGGCVLEATYGCDMGFAPWAATDIDGNSTEVCAFVAACLPDTGLCTLACETNVDCLVPELECGPDGGCIAAGGGVACETSADCAFGYQGGTVTCE